MKQIDTETLELYDILFLQYRGYLDWHSKNFLKGRELLVSNSNPLTIIDRIKRSSTKMFNTLGDLRIRYKKIEKQTNDMLNSYVNQGIIPNYIQEMYNYNYYIMYNPQFLNLTDQRDIEFRVQLSQHILGELQKRFPNIQYTQWVNTPDRYEFFSDIQGTILSNIKTNIMTRIVVGLGWFIGLIIFTILLGPLGFGLFLIGGIVWLLFLLIGNSFRRNANVSKPTGNGNWVY